MDAADFAAWVAHMKATRNWSARRCSTELGCGVNQIARWSESGAPPYIGLACAALAYGLPAWAVPQAARSSPAKRLLKGKAPLRVYRDLRGLTQLELSELSGVNRTAIAHMERGRLTGSVETLKKLADVLAVTVNDLV